MTPSSWREYQAGKDLTLTDLGPLKDQTSFSADRTNGRFEVRKEESTLRKAMRISCEDTAKMELRKVQGGELFVRKPQLSALEIHECYYILSRAKGQWD